MRHKIDRLFHGIVLSGVVALMCAAGANAQAQMLFATPEDAVTALRKAADSKDQNDFAAIFGPRIRELVSGDDIADMNTMIEFAGRIAASTQLVRVDANKFTLEIGEDGWPFAAPIVKSGDKWRFDSDAGIEELLNRRIGMNEIDAILVCQTYAIAQFEYFNGDDQDSDQVSEYAQKISSSPGKRDGLFWENAADNDNESPLGPLFAYASNEGYTAGKGTVESAAPFHGYHFKILFRQGPSAPGGKFDYMINGNMIAGFALIAYPAVWGNSGVMTFVVNQEGRVYEKNLGPRTSAIASTITAYDPDETWSLVLID